MRCKEKRRPVAASDIVASVVAKTKDQPRRGRRSVTSEVFAAFQSLGPPFVTHAEPIFFRKGSLTVVVEDSAWLTELTFLAPDILSRLNEAVGAGVVEQIRVRQGKLTRRAPYTPPELRPPPELNARQAQMLEELSSIVRDPDVRAALQKAARWHIAKY